jgi:hypothetical protein
VRKFFIGDIRGEVALLHKLMDQIKPDQDDFLIFLGGYLGPGANSKGTVDEVLNIKKHFPNAQCLIGCFEFLLTDMMQSGDNSIWADMWNSVGGGEVLHSYGTPYGYIRGAMPGGQIQRFKRDFVFPKTHIDFIEGGLYLYYKDSEFPVYATHGCLPRDPDHPELPDIVFGPDGWIKSQFRVPGHEIIFGHVPMVKPHQSPGKIGIDLGAGLGGKLCAFELRNREFTIVG